MISHEAAEDSLRKARICCESIAQFRYDQLGESQGASFMLDESSDAFNFQTGKSYFRAFRLPVKTLPYLIKIRSFALGEHIDKAHVFHPQIALLDDRFAIVKQSAPRDFSLSRAAYDETWGLPVKMEGYVLVDDPKARYVLVFTTRELMSGASPYEVQRVAPVILPGAVTALPTRKEEILIPHSPFGQLQLAITGVAGSE
jgi:maltose operon protein